MYPKELNWDESLILLNVYCKKANIPVFYPYYAYIYLVFYPLIGLNTLVFYPL